MDSNSSLFEHISKQEEDILILDDINLFTDLLPVLYNMKEDEHFQAPKVHCQIGCKHLQIHCSVFIMRHTQK